MNPSASIIQEVSASSPAPKGEKGSLVGKRVAVLLLAEYRNDARPRREAETLASEGMIVDVLCFRECKEDPVRECFNGVNILRLPAFSKQGGKLGYLLHYGGFMGLTFLLLAARSLRRRYDLVHVHNMPDILVFSAMVPKLLGARILLDLHDPMPELMRTIFEIPEESMGVRLLKFLEQRSIAFADAVLTVSETFRQIFCGRGCPEAKCAVAMNVPDEVVFPMREPEPLASTGAADPFIIMFHGSLVERHGLSLALEAVVRVRRNHPRAVLRIHGNSTPHLEDVLRHAREQGWEDSLDYRGVETLDGMVAAVDACDLGIVPNLRSVFTEINTPTRIFEFLYRGKPVIAPSGRGVREYFGAGDLLFFELGDGEDLARQIERAITDPEGLREIALRGREVCLGHRWIKERQNYLGLVRGLLFGKPLPPGNHEVSVPAVSASR